MQNGIEIGRFGAYTAYWGKLGAGDSRAAYVTGPCVDGSIRPIGSYWSGAEAIAAARRMAERDEREKGGK